MLAARSRLRPCQRGADDRAGSARAVVLRRMMPASCCASTSPFWLALEHARDVARSSARVLRHGDRSSRLSRTRPPLPPRRAYEVGELCHGLLGGRHRTGVSRACALVAAGNILRPHQAFADQEGRHPPTFSSRRDRPALVRPLSPTTIWSFGIRGASRAVVASVVRCLQVAVVDADRRETTLFSARVSSSASSHLDQHVQAPTRRPRLRARARRSSTPAMMI